MDGTNSVTFENVEIARKNYRAKLSQSLSWLIFDITANIIAIFTFMSKIGSNGVRSVVAPLAFGAIAVSTVGLCIAGIASIKKRRDYHKAYKAYFVERSLRNTFTNLSYNHQKGFDKERIRTIGMIKTGDNVYSNDLTIAKYKDINFARADVRITVETTDSDGHTSETNIFNGSIMIFDFPKQFNFRLEVIGKRFHAYTILPRNRVTDRKINRVETESTEFNRAFKVYGEDGFESFYILDPAMIEKIENIGKTYKHKLLLGFCENTLVVALDNGQDAFEPPSLGRPIYENTEISKITDEIKTITDFVDNLSLSPVFSK